MEDYLNLFIEESREHLQLLNTNLLEFEKNPNELNFVKEMFRSAHTLKGMAATMGFEKTSTLTHHMENIMDDIRNEKMQADESIVDLMFECLDSLERLVEEITDSRTESSEVSGLLKKIEHVHKTSMGVVETVRKEENAEPIKLSAFEEELARSAVKEGQTLFKIECGLAEDCALKSVRFNMVIKHLEKLGEIIKSQPDFQDVQPEELGNGAEFYVLTKHTAEEFEQIVHKVSEVEFIKVSNAEINEQIQTELPEKKDEKPVNADKKEEMKQTSQQQAKSIRVSIDKLEKMMSLFEEFIVEKARLSSISHDLKDSELEKSLERINRYSSEMQSAVLSMRMLPIDSVFNRFPRMVRNLAKDLHKEIELVITGSETELDRMMIDELGDPLVHLIRNSLDHGIELPEERKKKGKTATGTIRLDAFHKGNQAIIRITDDGNGIDPEKIKQKAIKNGALTEEDALKLNDQQIVQYIFASGFSTAEKVTDLSGRGVGLDVVKNKIEALGGSVSVETAKGTGSVFTISLPLTLSIVQTLVVKSGSQNVAVPLSNIVETTYVKDTDVKLLSNEPIIHFRGEVIPVKSVTDLFGSDFSNQKMQKENPTIIVSAGEKMFALAVSELVGQQEIVLKNLEGLLQNVKNVSGATILGDGSIAFIVDCNALLK